MLTSATCANEQKYGNIKDLTVRAGDTDLSKNNMNTKYQDRSVEKIIKHKDFIARNHYDDVALIILTAEFDITNNVGLICIPNQNQVFDGQKCWVSGFGANHQYGVTQSRLTKVEIPIVPNAKCQELLRNTVLSPWFILNYRFICAGGEGLLFQSSDQKLSKKF